MPAIGRTLCLVARALYSGEEALNEKHGAVRLGFGRFSWHTVPSLRGSTVKPALSVMRVGRGRRLTRPHTCIVCSEDAGPSCSCTNRNTAVPGKE